MDLFERKTRQVLLTAAGHQFHAQVGPALAQIGASAQALRGDAGLGFAVAPVSLITHDLASGRLVSPLPSLRLPLTRHYFGTAPDPSLETLRLVQWLKDAMNTLGPSAPNPTCPVQA